MRSRHRGGFPVAPCRRDQELRERRVGVACGRGCGKSRERVVPVRKRWTEGTFARAVWIVRGVRAVRDQIVGRAAAAAWGFCSKMSNNCRESNETLGATDTP